MREKAEAALTANLTDIDYLRGRAQAHRKYAASVMAKINNDNFKDEVDELSAKFDELVGAAVDYDDRVAYRLKLVSEDFRTSLSGEEIDNAVYAFIECEGYLAVNDLEELFDKSDTTIRASLSRLLEAERISKTDTKEIFYFVPR